MPTMVLRAFNAELAQIPDSVKQESLVQIRMQWWRDAVKSAYSGRPEPNPIILALREVSHPLPHLHHPVMPPCHGMLTQRPFQTPCRAAFWGHCTHFRARRAFAILMGGMYACRVRWHQRWAHPCLLLARALSSCHDKAIPPCAHNTFIDGAHNLGSRNQDRLCWPPTYSAAVAYMRQLVVSLVEMPPCNACRS